MRELRIVSLLLGLLVCVGIGGYLLEKPSKRPALSRQVVKVLQKGEHFEVLSLDPTAIMSVHGVELEGAPEVFHGYRIRGKTAVASKDERETLLKLLSQGIAKGDSEMVTLCFEPRHGLRSTFQDQSVDLVICFACNQINVSGTEGIESYQTKDDAAEMLNEILSRVELKELEAPQYSGNHEFMME